MLRMYTTAKKLILGGKYAKFLPRRCCETPGTKLRHVPVFFLAAISSHRWATLPLTSIPTMPLWTLSPWRMHPPVMVRVPAQGNSPRPLLLPTLSRLQSVKILHDWFFADLGSAAALLFSFPASLYSEVCKQVPCPLYTAYTAMERVCGNVCMCATPVSAFLSKNCTTAVTIHSPFTYSQSDCVWMCDVIWA